MGGETTGDHGRVYCEMYVLLTTQFGYHKVKVVDASIVRRTYS